MNRFMNTLKKTVMVLGLTAPLLFAGCQNGFNIDDLEADENKGARVVNAEGFEEFDEKEIKEAKEATKKDDKAKPKVVAFKGALARLFNIGANKFNEECKIENDTLALFAGYGEQAISGALEYLDGFLNAYTGGLYKTALGFLWPEEQTVDPQIAKIHESLDKLQTSVDKIGVDIENLSADMKQEFDADKVSDRIKRIENQRTAMFKMFELLEQQNADKEMDFMTYLLMKEYAEEAFGSIDKMRQNVQSFYTDYYSGDAVAVRSYGESYKLLGEEMYPWRYQTVDFMETMIGNELELATKMFVVSEILLNPNDNPNLLWDMMIQETMKNSPDAENLEKLVRINASEGKNHNEEVFNQIFEILAKYWTIEDYQIVDGMVISEGNPRRERFVTEGAIAGKAWDALCGSFEKYVNTINAIYIPVDNPDEITCNIRGIKCTFSKTIEARNYTASLRKLAECKVEQKTEANWLNLYKKNSLPGEKVSGFVRMLTKDDYQKILDFYSSKNRLVKDENGKVVKATLYNIFRYEAGMTLENVTPGDVRFACYESSEKMGFVVDNERSDKGMSGPWYDLTWNVKTCFDGLHFWNVSVPSVESNNTELNFKNDKILGDMAARSSDKACINRTKYYNDSYSADKLFLVPNVVNSAI